MPKTTEVQVVRSALWAAYGDVLGFPTELISQSDFKNRNGFDQVTGPFTWKRRIGGLAGPEITFSAGSYSDDTQLRLSVSRSIRGDGFFDVESFAKIELPVWLNYSLGAGRSSKLAAANLGLKDSTWSQNFFDSARVRYWEGGGNGAAMRVQPHVWAGHCAGFKSFLPDVIRNTVCTHGHPRAIIGAAIHAYSLFHALISGEIASPEDWADFGEAVATDSYQCLLDDEELSLIWVPAWEQRSGTRLQKLWTATKVEWVEACKVVTHLCREKSTAADLYPQALISLGGFEDSERGSGLKTPLYANLLAWLFRDQDATEALLLSANTFKSDTDTIGTMAGALLGAVSSSEPNGPIQDYDYIVHESRRLHAVANGVSQKSFEYPDLLSWSAPKSQSDAWVETDLGSEITGLGRVEHHGETITSKKLAGFEWAWCRLHFGQTILAKRRHIKNHAPQPVQPISSLKSQEAQSEAPRTLSLNSHSSNLDYLSQVCIRSGFDPKVIGESLLTLSEGSDGIEKAIAFSAIIAKAKMARSKK